MKRNFIVRPEAEQDISEAFDWYEEQRKGLGHEFLLRVEATLDSLVYEPYVYAPIYKDIRRKLLRRFPYGVFYVVGDDNIVVLAVIHAKRHPRTWKLRR